MEINYKMMLTRLDQLAENLINNDFYQNSFFENKLIELQVENNLTTWLLESNHYPDHVLHMGKLRFPTKNGNSKIIEICFMEWLRDYRNNPIINFVENRPWKKILKYGSFENMPYEEQIIDCLNAMGVDLKRLEEVLQKYNCLGLPDLLEIKNNHVYLWEVKQELDQYDKKQQRLFSELANLGIPVNVVFIKEKSNTLEQLIKRRTQASSIKDLCFLKLRETKIYNELSPYFNSNYQHSDRSNYNTFKNIENGIYYSAYELARVIEYYSYRLPLFSSEEIIEFSMLIFASGSYNWWKFPINLIPKLKDKEVSLDLVRLLETAIHWDKITNNFEEDISYMEYNPLMTFSHLLYVVDINKTKKHKESIDHFFSQKDFEIAFRISNAELNR